VGRITEVADLKAKRRLNTVAGCSASPVVLVVIEFLKGTTYKEECVITQRSTSRGPTLVLLLLAPILAGGVLLACKYVPLARAQGSDDASWNRQFAAGEILYARANIARHNLDGWFGPDVTVWFTGTTPSGITDKGTGSGTTGPDGWMDGRSGNCDMVPGDRVLVASSAGFNAQLVPIDIQGRIDVAADRVSGKMSGGVFPGHGNIWVWSEGRRQGSGKNIDIGADGHTAPISLGSSTSSPATGLRCGTSTPTATR